MITSPSDGEINLDVSIFEDGKVVFIEAEIPVWSAVDAVRAIVEAVRPASEHWAHQLWVSARCGGAYAESLLFSDATIIELAQAIAGAVSADPFARRCSLDISLGEPFGREPRAHRMGFSPRLAAHDERPDEGGGQEV